MKMHFEMSFGSICGVAKGFLFCAVILSAVVSLTGCKPSEVKFSQTLLNGATVVGLPVDGSAVNGSFSLPALCKLDLQNVLLVANSHINLQQKIDDYYITSENMILEDITLTATEGSFSSFDAVSMRLTVGGQTFDLGAGSFYSEDTVIVFAPDDLDLLDALWDTFDVSECSSASVDISGLAPSGTLKFTVSANWLYRYYSSGPF